MFARALLLALLPLVCIAHADKPEGPAPVADADYPWFTGSLLSFASEVIPVGYINLETYFQVFDYFGLYNKHWHAESVPRFLTCDPFVYFQIGVTESIDFAILPQIFYQQSQGQSSTNIGDLNVGFDFQLLTEKEGSWRPSIKLITQEEFPLGKYQRLDPKKKGTDATGNGSYESTLGLAIGKLIHISGIHYLSTRANFLYTYFTPVHVKGFNAYGGGFGTKGTVRPGSSFSALAAMEYSLTKNWALALDINYTHFDRTRFSGRRGVTVLGTPASISFPSSEQFSLAPAIEYNFSESLGIIAGSWFTIAGRNASQFVSGIIALNFYTNISSKKPESLPYPGGGAGAR